MAKKVKAEYADLPMGKLLVFYVTTHWRTKGILRVQGQLVTRRKVIVTRGTRQYPYYLGSDVFSTEERAIKRVWELHYRSILYTRKQLEHLETYKLSVHDWHLVLP